MQTPDRGGKDQAKISGLPFFGAAKSKPIPRKKAEAKKSSNPNPPSAQGGAAGAGRSGVRAPKEVVEVDVVAQIDAFVGPEDPRLDPTNPQNIKIKPTEANEGTGGQKTTD